MIVDVNGTRAITQPESMEELDAQCEQWRSSMSKRFDFVIGKKKQDKLRDAVASFWGFPNGYQQMKATFPVDYSKTEPYPDQWPDVIILSETDDGMYLYPDVKDMHWNRMGDIQEIQNHKELGIPEIQLMEYDEVEDSTEIRSYFGVSADKVHKALMGHYEAQAIVVKVPEIEKYGLSGVADERYLEREIKNRYGFDSGKFIRNYHELIDMGDSSLAQVYVKLVKKPKA